ncbi:LysM peptidoglycan-binding domain-containing protein [Vagococcus fluvialis]|uniref:LysM peptidoglycan-binding domain-containing protein n=1 Tax=Vagococcus fluvialis TaxID=2738 RepID=UPI003B20E131
MWNNLKNSTIYVGKILQVERSTQITHVVVKGDTLWSISQKYKTTVDKIKKDNNLKSDLLVVGLKLKV